MIGGGSAGVDVGFNKQLFSGRPDTQSVEDFEDCLLAAYAKAKLRKKKPTKAEFLLQLPAYLEHEALQSWRKLAQRRVPDGARKWREGLGPDRKRNSAF